MGVFLQAVSRTVNPCGKKMLKDLVFLDNVIIVSNAVGKFCFKTGEIISPGGLVHYRSSFTLDNVL